MLWHVMPLHYRYALKCVSKKQAAWNSSHLPPKFCFVMKADPEHDSCRVDQVEQKQQKALAHERNILAELDRK